jgi:hypothetical protein
MKNDGRYLDQIGSFTERLFEGTKQFYLGWLRLALDHIQRS